MAHDTNGRPSDSREKNKSFYTNGRPKLCLPAVGAVPAFLPITSPDEETVHTLGLLLLHVILLVVPMTSSVYLSYCSRVMLDLLIASE